MIWRRRIESGADKDLEHIVFLGEVVRHAWVTIRDEKRVKRTILPIFVPRKFLPSFGKDGVGDIGRHRGCSGALQGARALDESSSSLDQVVDNDDMQVLWVPVLDGDYTLLSVPHLTANDDGPVWECLHKDVREALASPLVRECHAIDLGSCLRKSRINPGYESLERFGICVFVVCVD